MFLKRVGLENFKRFKKLDRELSPGINVVKGPLNEIGKSTLLDGMVAALFENPKSTRKGLERYTTWGSEHRCKTVIEFEAEGKRYVLEKDFDMKTMQLASPGEGMEWNTPKEIAERLRELLGTDSATLFLSTCCVRQGEVSDISSGKKEIGESLEGIVTGGPEEAVASQVIEKLDRQIGVLVKGLERLTKSPGPIARLTQQVQKLQQELAEVAREVTEVEGHKLELVEVSKELGQVEVKLGDAEALLEKNRRRQEIEERINKLEKEYEKIDTLIRDIESLQKQIQETESALQTIEGFDDFQRVLEFGNQLRELEAKRENISGDIPERKQELESALEYLKRNKLLKGLASSTSLVIGVAVSIAGFLGMLVNMASLAAGVIGLLFLLGAMWARSSLTRQKTRISELQERIRQMEEAMGEVDEQEGAILSQVRCASLEEFRQKERKQGELVKQKEASQNQLLGRLGGQTLDQVEQQRRETARMLAEERERFTDDLRSTKLSPEEYVRREKEVESLRTKKDELRNRKLECEVGIQKARFDAEDQAQREEMLDALTRALDREQRRVQVYQLARDFVSRARAETLLSATDVLQAEIQRNFEVFTNGKYRKVRIIEGALDFSIYSEEKGGWTKPEELSGGAVDEFYLACRLALVRLIYGGTQPPLVLDDPFVNFDEPRLARTLEYLGQLSKEQQIIIFTLREAYDSIADKVIELT